jgi:GTP pyrophosphokinase
MARWTKPKEGVSFIATIKISGVDEAGIVNRIADVLTENKVTVRNFSYNMDEGMFEGMLNIMVSNSNVLHGVIRKIQSIKGILRALRIDHPDNRV